MSLCECGYESKYPSNLKRHQKKCAKIALKFQKEKFENLIIEKETMCSNENVKCLDLEKKIIHLYKIIENKDKLIMSLSKSLSNNPKKTTNNIIIQNIIPFNNEPISLLPPINIVKNILNTPSESVPAFVELKHFKNEKMKNIRLCNMKGSTIQVAENVDGVLKWVHHERRSFIDKLFEHNLEILINTYNANSYKNWNDWYCTFRLGDVNARTYPEWKEQMNKMNIMLINNRF